MKMSPEEEAAFKERGMPVAVAEHLLIIGALLLYTFSAPTGTNPTTTLFTLATGIVGAYRLGRTRRGRQWRRGLVRALWNVLVALLVWMLMMGVSMLAG